MAEIKINAYAKINLCIDVLGRLPDGYHQVEMVMQQVDLYDTVTVRSEPCGLGGGEGIFLSVSRADLPVNEDNLAYKAARLMRERYGPVGSVSGENPTLPEISISVDLKKRIPVAAGLAGGSADGAAVLHGLNRLWGLNLPLEELMELGGQLGSDVPFCIMGQAALNPSLGFSEKGEGGGTLIRPSACALASGTGKELRPVLGLHGFVVLSKPDIAVSTAEVYGGLRLSELAEADHPCAVALSAGIAEGNLMKVKVNMKNMLESVTLERYPEVRSVKREMERACGPYHVLMSGSGPTVFGLYFNRKKAEAACERMGRLCTETYLARLL